MYITCLKAVTGLFHNKSNGWVGWENLQAADLVFARKILWFSGNCSLQPISGWLVSGFVTQMLAICKWGPNRNPNVITGLLHERYPPNQD